MSKLTNVKYVELKNILMTIYIPTYQQGYKVLNSVSEFQLTACLTYLSIELNDKTIFCWHLQPHFVAVKLLKAFKYVPKSVHGRSSTIYIARNKKTARYFINRCSTKSTQLDKTFVCLFCSYT